MCGEMHRGDPAGSGGGARVVVVGKGGVGKSTIAALLARILARQGRTVLAVDADEQMNLGATLGFGPAAIPVPLTGATEYIEERTGARPGRGAGGMLRLNPDVSDVAERLGEVGPDGVRLLVMGGVAGAGSGCLCPETSILAATVRSMRLQAGDVVVMDTHAGVEHFGRSLAAGFDQALVVVDPTFNSVKVGADSARLARELGIDRLHLVVNRARRPDDLPRALDHLHGLGQGGWDFASVRALPYDEQALEADPSVEVLLAGSRLAGAAAEMAAELIPTEVAAP